MTTYLAFNENEGLDNITDTFASTTTAVVSGVNRAGFWMTAALNELKTRDATIPTAITEGWVHVRTYIHDKVNSSDDFSEVFYILDTAGASVVKIRRTYDVSEDRTDIQIITPNGGTTTVYTGVADAAYNWDFNIKLDATTGFIKVYQSGALVVDESGDTTVTSGITQFDTLRFAEHGYSFNNTSGEGEAIGFSQVVVSSAITTGCKLYTLVPIAGSINDWDAGTVTDVDETAINDSDKATTTTNNDEFTIDTSTTLSTPTLPNKFKSVILSYRASYDSGSAVTKLTPLLNDTTATSTSFSG